MKLEKGDKVVCKRTLNEFDLIKDTTYYVVGKLNDIYYFNNQFGKTISLGIPENQIYLYFYDKQETRKIKLEKLKK